MMDGSHDPEAAFRAAGAREERFTAEPPPRGKPFGHIEKPRGGGIELIH
jgi:hypothetical protein